MKKFLAGVAVALIAAYAVVHFNILDVTGEKNGVEKPKPMGSGDWVGNADEIRGHLNFLADDLLEGREAGTRGYDIAALYAANHFASLGLKPAGDNGSYFQMVPLRAVDADFSASRFSIAREDGEVVFEPQQDFVMGGRSAHEASSVTAPMVFVGWGIDAPAFGVNSYEDIDVDGKIVVYFRGGPSQMPAEERAHFGSGATKAALAESKGAVGVIAIYTSAFEKIAPFERLVRGSARTGMTWIGSNGEPHDGYPQLQIVATIAPESTERLFDGTDMTYAELRASAEGSSDLPGFDLVGEASISQRSTHAEVESANILAVLDGSDPALKDEYVVYTAHLDHTGIGPEVDGDRVYNGAVDNASGSAIVLDLARAFVEAGDRPRRSILFFLNTAEEKGLRGAGYYANNPTVPIESIVANVNIDGALIFFDFADVIAFGDTHSTMKMHVETAANAMGLDVLPDPYPDEGLFTRSDHYRFVQQGVPAVFTLLGLTATDGSKTGKEVFETYLATQYHKPNDDLLLPFDYDIGAKFVEFQYRLGRSVADTDERPEWNEGDFFGDLYGRE